MRGVTLVPVPEPWEPAVPSSPCSGTGFSAAPVQGWVSQPLLVLWVSSGRWGRAITARPSPPRICHQRRRNPFPAPSY